MIRFAFLFWFLVFFMAIENLNCQSAFKDISFSSQIAHFVPHTGIAFCDFNGDGREDIYLSVRDGENRLYRNLGDEYFVEIAKSVGVNTSFGSRASIFFDMNNDGWQDLYVGNYGSPDQLYLNQGDGTFANITQQSGINNWGWPLSVNVCDIDQDGDVDIYVSNSALENVLYRNNGNLTFTDIIYAANATDPKISMGSIFFDYDNDGDQDLYLVHDSNQANILYQNNGHGQFTDVSAIAGVNYRGNGMGVDVGDLNNDGWLDLYVTNLFENVLFLNNGDGTFSDITNTTKVDDFGMGWGTNIFDYNNDGFLDIYVANDSNFSPYPNVLYINKGGYVFEKLEDSDPICSMQGSYGSAIADIDMDGRLDVAVANYGTNQHSQLFHNQMEESGNWIGFLLEGVESNRNAIGSRIELIDETGKIYISEVKAGSGYCSQSSYIQHFGLGEASRIDGIVIKWASGFEQVIVPLDMNHYYKVKEREEPLFLNETVSSIEELNISELKIFPNPAFNFIQISLELIESNKLSIDILNIEGKVMIKMLDNAVLSKGYQEINTDISQLLSGLYFIKFSTSHGSEVRKVIIN